jgi:hypothetical protein
MIETLLYGCKKGEPKYMEEILYQCKGYTNKNELMEKGQKWADKNGYDRLRISVIDLTQKPNFANTINLKC